MRTQLKFYVAAVIGAAVVYSALLPWSALGDLATRDFMGLAGFVLLASLTEYLAVESGGRVRSSVSFLPLLSLIVLFPLPAVVLGLTLMWLLSEVRPGKNWISLAFNQAQLVLAYVLAGTAFTAIRGMPPGIALGTNIDSLGLVVIPFAGAAATFFGVNILLVSSYIAIRDEQRLRAIISEAMGPGGGNFFYDLLASPIALLAAYLYWQFHVAGLVAVVLPLLLIRYSYLSAVQLEHANRDLLRVLIKAIETRDPYTSGHSLRVSTLARLVAEDHGLRPRTCNDVEDAALLHDIGKIDALYAEIISKGGSLTDQERAVIRTHASKGADLLESLTSLKKEIIVGVRHHHERYDGTGYPDGLAGKSIPVAGRIIMICDAVDAMLSDRPYRDALPVGHVRKELDRCSGTQFDPDLVKTILDNNTLERAEMLVDRSGARTPVRAVAG